MIKQHGFLSIYKGTWITVARDGPGYGMWFVTYEFCTQKLSNDGTASSLTTFQLLLAGGIAGIMSWICNYPLDVIKTQFQANDSIHSYGKVCQNIMKTYGIKGIAGIMSWICNYPLDVIKTQFQANDSIHSYGKSLSKYYENIWYQRAIPANASIFFAAEWSYRLLCKTSEWHEIHFSKKM
ncbi:hypothetical protein LOAG_17912 [Loa loa]|uniref:Uncharacterized protein n=1 Tax=Loa loa TaxID=7209 RepID=A0A1S0UHI2_LOALO|nr:hypothetical protein LOAG_17912 [Loa loa]EJD74828.1 hypothetical protein LOAG_17912 [Loa loa]